MADQSPPYLRIADGIRDRIASGQLRPGDQVPSARRITQEFGVALATATKVLATLQAEGLTKASPGVGTVVAATADPVRPAAPVMPAHGCSASSRSSSSSRSREC